MKHYKYKINITVILLLVVLCHFVYYQKLVLSEFALVADLNCFTVLWAESHLSKRVVFTVAKSNPPL